MGTLLDRPVPRLPGMTSRLPHEPVARRSAAGARRSIAPPPSLLPGVGRRQLAFIVGVIVVAWIVVVFARAVATSASTNARADTLRAQNDALQAQYVAQQRELTVVQGDSFVKLQARAYGLGEPGERVFSLQAGAPAPQAIGPLGADVAAPPTASPLEGWLALLFGP